MKVAWYRQPNIHIQINVLKCVFRLEKLWNSVDEFYNEKSHKYTTPYTKCTQRHFINMFIHIFGITSSHERNKPLTFHRLGSNNLQMAIKQNTPPSLPLGIRNKKSRRRWERRMAEILYYQIWYLGGNAKLPASTVTENAKVQTTPYCPQVNAVAWRMNSFPGAAIAELSYYS